MTDRITASRSPRGREATWSRSARRGSLRGRITALTFALALHLPHSPSSSVPCAAAAEPDPNQNAAVNAQTPDPSASAATISAPFIVAHRGASAAAPENTLAAFREAWRQRADAIEGDFWMTADGEIVCLHDASLERVSGLARDVREMTLDELRDLDVGAWKDERWRGEKIPTLHEVLDAVPDGGRILIEIKDSERLVPRLVEVLASIPPAALDEGIGTGGGASPGTTPRIDITIIAFDETVVAAVKKALPKVPTYWLVGAKKIAEMGPAAVVRRAVALGADGLDIQAKGAPVAELRKRTREAGLELHVWTVNDPASAPELRALGVESITTDVPDAMRAALER